MLFWIMFVGVCAGFAIDAKYPPSTNVVLGLLAAFLFFDQYLCEILFRKMM